MTTPFPQWLIDDFLDIRGQVVPLTGAVLGRPTVQEADEYEKLLRRLLRHARTIAADPTDEERVGAYDQTYKLVGDLLERLHPHIGGQDGNARDLARLYHTYLGPARDVMVAAIDWKHHGAGFNALARRDVPPDGLDTVLAQAAYMSGDMFGVSAALTLNPGMGLALFYDPAANADRDVRAHLLRFYDGAGGAPHPRVALVPTTDCEAAYRLAQDGNFPARVFPLGRPPILANVQRCVAIGRGTAAVAEAFGTTAETAARARDALAREWLPAGWRTGQVTAPGGGKTIAQWVTEKFGQGDRAYCFVWFRRSGAKGGAHQELDTSVVAIRDLIGVLREGRLIQNATVVMIGDSGHGLAHPDVDIDLTEYWTEQGSPFVGGDRRAQLALFAYLVERKTNFMNVGMRSGALEGPALLGARTVYLEERYNLQEGRMEQWQGRVPGYTRIELGHVPTASGKRILKGLLEVGVKRGERELDTAAGYLAGLLRLPKADLKALVQKIACRGVVPADHRFEPPEVAQCFTDLCREVGSLLKAADLRKALGGSWNDFRYAAFAGLRAAQSIGKAEVKLRMGRDYDGPEEGLSKTDRERLWQAMAQTIDNWQVKGRRK
ncbi:hypothetical protein GCM10009678_83910 [Actinomadura kijaniata]|uniref:Uncharacterized protein n=1 Tax=Actinomadura namibiensis TaxID=182080 RepID=A0A7W3QPX7_ACTNM|nr:hypothetical protein [Actinomadura namibiensis]MBA8955046.1 hypothetical protein [Actinomadura namibiensis]